MRKEIKDRFFMYWHENKSTHFRRYVDPGDIEEMVESDFVVRVFELTEEQWCSYQRAPTKEEKVATALSDSKADPRELPNGLVAVLK